jgi:hypothetical protein
MPGTLIRIERQSRKSGGPRIVNVYKCSIDNCDNEIKMRNGEQNHSGMCLMHSHRKRPYESIYHRLFNDHRKLGVSLTYEEFVEFTKIKKCHYCNQYIDWLEYATVGGKFLSTAYYLDRKDLIKGYSKDNCVVCCTDCNNLRGNRFSYEEFLLLSPVLEKIRINRMARN